MRNEETIMTYINNEMELVNEVTQLMMDEVDPDVYDGEHSINCFTAMVHLNTDLVAIRNIDEVNYILKYFTKLPVKPTEIRIYGDVGYIEIDWISNGYPVVNSKAEYIELVMEFKLFLRKFKSPFFNIHISDSFYFFNGAKSIKGISENVINFTPRFNQECFGSDKDITVKELTMFF